MQLAAEHRIDLQADVNGYLPAALQIPDEGFGPVHVWNLMTHTAGFEDAAIPHLFRLGDTPVESLDDYLARYRPHRVRPLGQHADYSNYSVALLGALVAHVSGKPFEQVIDERLFQPLGMTHSTFREPLPQTDPRHMADALIHDPSTPFRREQGAFKDEPYEHVAAIGPAGALSTTELLRSELAEKFVSRTRDDWQERFERTDACVAPVLSPWEAHLHPHNQARSTFVEVDGVVQPAPAPRFSRTPSSISRPPSLPGGDTVSALLDWGIEEATVAKLRETGALS